MKTRYKVRQMREAGMKYKDIQKHLGFKSVNSVTQYLGPCKSERTEYSTPLWDYLVKKLRPLNDNNKTAKEIWVHIDRANLIKNGIEDLLSKKTIKAKSNVEIQCPCDDRSCPREGEENENGHVEGCTCADCHRYYGKI